MATKPVARSNAAGIGVTEEDVGRDEDKLEDKTVKLDTSVKVSSGRWVASTGTLDSLNWRLRLRATRCVGVVGPSAQGDRSIAL
ncbi:hypothetical protein TrVFT333_010687 [Trichoderma virens FT-333]|nr:hypothetical protein TrVFT333_010687 [Trichoderma virens FT-333]